MHPKNQARVLTGVDRPSFIGSQTVGTTEARRVRSALLESISRDVARPLALIAGAASGLRTDDDASGGAAVQEGLIDTIQIEAERLQHIAALLLDLAELECDAVEVRSEMVDFADIVRAAVKEVAKTTRDRKIEVGLSADLPKLRLDPRVFRRLLVILLEIAVRETPPSSKVSIHAACDARVVRLQVLDERDAILPADHEKIFGQFDLPCADDLNRSGSGMALAVCRGYVEAMGGEIAASNRTDGRGAVFTLTFPIAA